MKRYLYPYVVYPGLLLAPLPVFQGDPNAPDSKPATAPKLTIGRPATRPAGTASRESTTFHDRVLVMLKNGQKLNGIVKNKKFAERAEGFNYFSTDKDSRGSGLRLWYTRAGQSYLFIPYDEIAHVDTVARVSDLEVRELEESLLAEVAEKRDREAGDRLAMLKMRDRNRDDERASVDQAAEETRKKESEKKKTAAIEKAKRILDRFPPEQGWGEEKKKDIIAKKASRIYPDAEESAFLKLFDSWREAKAIVDAAEAGEELPVPAGDAPEGGGDGTAGDGSTAKKSKNSKNK